MFVVVSTCLLSSLVNKCFRVVYSAPIFGKFVVDTLFIISNVVKYLLIAEILSNRRYFILLNSVLNK